MRSTVGTRYAIISVWVFMVVRRALYHTKLRRDMLTNSPIWALIYVTIVYKYENLMFTLFSTMAVLFSPTTCIQFRTPGAPGTSYDAQ